MCYSHVIVANTYKFFVYWLKELMRLWCLIVGNILYNITFLFIAEEHVV